MKKNFGHTGRPNPTGRKHDWDDYEPLEDEELDGADEEYYTDEESEEYYGEEGTEQAYSGEESESYYTEESGEAGAEEAYYGEYYEDGSGEVVYEEGYEGEEGTYTEDDAAFDGEIIYTEDGDDGYTDSEITYEDNNFYIAEFEDEEDDDEDEVRPVAAAPRRPRPKKAAKKISAMDCIIALSGVAVLFLAIILGSTFLKNRNYEKQVADFVNVGTQLNAIHLIGEQGIAAIADAKIAQLAAASTVIDIPEPEDPDDKIDYGENEYTRQLTVVMNMTSIQKDLKIKFTNESTGKLIANVPFSVTVKSPDGKTSIWSDDDMDGIIYKKDIAAGSYKITMEELTDDRYSNYYISTMTRTTEVKKDIAYAKVDVSNEVKSESEIDSKKEDTKKNETLVESSLTDTVTWVESKVTIATYSEFSKTLIPDPLTLLANPIKTTASAKGLFSRMTTTAVGTVKADAKEVKVGSNLTLKAEGSATTDVTGESIDKVVLENITWKSLNTDIATVDANGVVTGVKLGDATIMFDATAVITVATTVEATPSPSPEASPSPSPEASPSPSPEATPTPAPEASPSPSPEGEPGTNDPGVELTTIKSPVSGSISIKVVDALKKGTLEADKKSVTMACKGTAEVKLTATDFVKDKELIYKLESIDNTDIATASVDTATGKITLKGGEKAGTTKIYISVNYKENGTEETKAMTSIEVKVSAGSKISFEKEEGKLVYAEVNDVLNAYIEEFITKTPEITVKSSDETILKAKAGTIVAGDKKLTVPVNLEPLAEGTITLTIISKEGDLETKAVYSVVVKTNPKKDVKTELTDSLGNKIYVKDNTGEYRQAHYADYYTYDKFYVKGDAKYQGWQTIDGKVYYYTADGKAVTGEQVIQGAKYNFASDGSLVTGTGALGIDVSKWNGTIDWKAVKNSGVNYVIIRCGYRGSTEGKLIMDPKFTTNIKGATAAGLKVGVYFFTQAVDEREAVEEASMVLDSVKNYKISYPIFLDVEPSGGRGDKIDSATRTAVCKAFCQTIKNAGYTAGIYANKSWLETKLDPSALSAYKIWLAQYAATPTYTGRYDMWQYRATGKVSGISGDVDMNLSYLGY